MRQKWIGYYTLPAFWAGQPVDPSDRHAGDRLRDTMQEQVFSYDIPGCTVRICRDGMIMLRVARIEAIFDEARQDTSKDRMAKLVSAWNEYLDYANCYYLLLVSDICKVQNLSGVLHLTTITRREAYRMTTEDGVLSSCSRANPEAIDGPVRYRYRSFVDPASALTMALHRPVVPREVFDLARDEFEIVASDTKLRERLSRLAKSIVEYKAGNYAVSLVLAWFVIEAVLSDRWASFRQTHQAFGDGTARIWKDRMEALANGRDYTAAVISNILELSDQLPIALFRKIDAARRERNDVVHKSKGADPQTCQDAITAALQLATEGKLEVLADLSYSVVS